MIMRAGIRRLALWLAMGAAFGALCPVPGQTALPNPFAAPKTGGEFLTTLGMELPGDGRRQISSGFTLRLKLRSGEYPWRLYADGAVRLSRLYQPGDRWQADGEMERLYTKASFPALDVSLGRQEISWGLGYAWSPTDLFNPPDPLDPGGRRKGVDALVVQVPVGPLAYWSLVAARQPAPGSSWQAGMLRRGSSPGLDWALLAVGDSRESRAKGTAAIGGHIKLDRGASWTGETACFLPPAGGSARCEVVLGIDYSWLYGHLIWREEYLYNSGGAETKEKYGEALTAVAEGQLKYLARHYLYNQLTWQADQFTSVTASLITNLIDLSMVWTLAGRVYPASNWQILAALSGTAGRPGGEFTPSGSAGTAAPAPMIRMQVQYSF